MTTILHQKPISFEDYIQFHKETYTNYKIQFDELKAIMEDQRLNTYYQPILDIQQDKIIGFEALNRPISAIFHNVDTFYDFIGTSRQVFAFERLCRNLSIQRFHERLSHEKKKSEPILFLNIHPNVLLDSNYSIGETRQILDAFDFTPEQVVFELTEKCAVTDFDEFARVLNHYRQQGYRIAVDDVGSGYNSLKTLIYLKPEFIKIDRSLITNIGTEFPQQQLVQILVNYAKQTNTKVIAEGIESAEELAFLKQVGVDYAQGYAIGKPNKNILFTY